MIFYSPFLPFCTTQKHSYILMWIRLESSLSVFCLGWERRTTWDPEDCSCGGDFYDGFPLRFNKVWDAAMVGEHAHDLRTPYLTLIFCPWTATDTSLLHPAPWVQQSWCWSLGEHAARWTADSFWDCPSPSCHSSLALASQTHAKFSRSCWAKCYHSALPTSPVLLGTEGPECLSTSSSARKYFCANGHYTTKSGNFASHHCVP